MYSGLEDQSSLAPTDGVVCRQLTRLLPEKLAIKNLNSQGRWFVPETIDKWEEQKVLNNLWLNLLGK